MRGALDFFGLAGVLFVILVVGPYVRGFTEGFSADVTKSTMTPSEVKEKVAKLGQQLIQLNKFLEDPTIDSSTKEKIVKEKEEIQAEVAKLSGTPLPSAEVEPKKEGFVGVLSAEMEKPTKGNEMLQNAAQNLL